MFDSINDRLIQRRARQIEAEQWQRWQAEKAEQERREQEILDTIRSVYLSYIKACQHGAPFRRKVRQPGMRIRLTNYFNVLCGEMETKIVVRSRHLRLTCTVIYTKQARSYPPIFSYS